MQIVVMSDTHGDSHVIDRVRGFYPQVEIMIHCGDSELPFSHAALDGMKKVRGNCDLDKAFPEEIIVQAGDAALFVTHGHLFNVKSSMLALSYRAKEVAAHIVCFGHSHLLGAEMIDDVLFINPGSLLKPRGGKEKSFAVIDIQASYYQVDFFTENNDRLSTHTFVRA